uniref:Peptidase S72 domain-containing protein n=1 Tax=Panagrolaimus sp. ES5 TaxID=591445 RepID=A0AC34FP08_9BILA
MVVEDTGQLKLMEKRIHIALHVLKENVKLIFPKDKTFPDLLSKIKLYSPTGNGKCQDTRGSLEFTLLIANQYDIHGKIMVLTDPETSNVMAYLYEKCKRAGRTDDYASPPIDVNPVELAVVGRICPNNVPFEPSYMQIEDYTLPDASRLVLNESYAGNDETFWWKNKNDEMLPPGVEFDGSGNIRINISKSTKENPHFFRIGQNQPLPSLQFQFDTKCDGFKFGMFLNLQDPPECKIDILVTQNGFNISTKTITWHEIKDSTFSPTLVFGDKKVYAKIASPLYIKELQTCDFKTSSDVATDQFVLQLARDTSVIVGQCDNAQIIIPKNDFASGIEVLIDRAKIEKNTTENETITILPTNITTNIAAAAGMEWWWFLIIGGILLITVVIIIIIVFCVCRRRRKSRKSNDNNPPKCLEKRAPKMKTAISKESPPKEKIKEKKKTKTKTKTKTKDEEVNESKKSEKPKQAKSKPAKKNIDEPGLESFRPPPKGKLMPFSKEEDVSQSDKRSAVQQASTQNDPTVEAAATTQETAPEIVTAENAGVHPVLRACAALKDE